MLPTVPQNPPWKFVDIIIILVIINLFGLVLGYLSEFVMHWVVWFFPTAMDEQILFFFMASIIQTGLFVGFSIYVVIGKYRGQWAHLGLMGHNWQINVTKGFFGGLGLFSIVVGAGAIITYFYPMDPEPQPFAELIMNATGPKQLMLLLIMGSVLAPLGEEIFFRGLVYPVFRKRFGVIVGIIFSSLIFSTLHFDLLRLIPIAIGGMGLAWLYERTGSLITPIIAHSVWNTIMTLMIVMAGIT